MLAELPFLGRKINLISKCDIRYEGVLYSIDPKESTIALSKVRSFGTEDRVTGRGFIPSKDEVYQYIIFRASDVKDLKLGDSDHLMGLSDPAIIQAVGPKSLNHQGSSNKLGSNNRGQNYGPNSRRPRYDRPRRQARRGNQTGQRSGGQRDGRATSEQRSNQQRGGLSQRQSSRGPSRQQRGGGNSRFRRQISDLRRESIKFDCEFDFQKANEEFAELNQKLSEQLNIGDANPTPAVGDGTTVSATETGAVKTEFPAYDKERSFFDSLTCRQTTKPDWRKERRINAETFGVAY